jgi:hypothetical protein
MLQVELLSEGRTPTQAEEKLNLLSGLDLGVDRHKRRSGGGIG